MGQKVNPKIIRIGKYQEWDSKYIEKKSSEFSQQTFNDLNIKIFIEKFLNNNGIILNRLKLNHSETSLHIYISYFLSFEYNILENQNIKFTPTNKKLKKKKTNLYKRTTKNFFRYSNLKYKLTVLKKIRTKILKLNKNIIKNETNLKKFRRINNIKLYNTKRLIKNSSNLNLIFIESFLEKLLANFNIFNKNKFKIFITFEQINKNLKQFILKNKIKIIKKILIRLRKYKQNKFFKEGINVLFSTIKNKNSSFLLAKYISNQLQKIKRHNFFLRFLKAGLALILNRKISNLKGIKIKIKGRLNGTPRARHKTILIRNGVSAITLKSNIDYSETTAFTKNGTLGVKVWIENNF